MFGAPKKVAPRKKTHKSVRKHIFQ